MGMYLSLVRVSEAQLRAFQEEPSQFEELIYDESSFDQDWYLDLDKTWDGLLYILTGEGLSGYDESNVAGRALFSGQLLDPKQDLGYGPAHYLEAAEVKEACAALRLFTSEEVANRFDPADMAVKNLYPAMGESPEDLDYLSDGMARLRQFYEMAAAEGQAILSWVS